MKHVVISTLLLVSIGHASDVLHPITPAPVSANEVRTDIKPKIPEKKFTVPALPPHFLALPNQKIEMANYTADVVQRLQQAAKEVRLLEVWSLDPSVWQAGEMEEKSKPYPFYGFHSLGREELKDKDEVQKLLFSVTLSIAKSPDEAYMCFDARHGLRIHDQKGFIDVLLCYTCLQGVIYDGKDEKWFTTTKDAEADFDGIFARLGLRKAE